MQQRRCAIQRNEEAELQSSLRHCFFGHSDDALVEKISVKCGQIASDALLWPNPRECQLR